MSVDTLLSRLDRVKRTGPDRYIARCPAHEDKGPSLSIRALADGRTLVHCFGGCDVSDVLAAAGMAMEDLFPPRPLHDGHKRERRPFSADDALRCLDFEATLVLVAAQDVLAGTPLSDADRERLAVAVERITLAKGASWTS